jgi:hypothetical protein
VPLSVLSSPSAVHDDDNETPYGHVHHSLPARPAHEPTRVPTIPFSTPPEEEGPEAFLRWVEACGLQSPSLMSTTDGETYGLDLVAAHVDEMMATAEGKDNSARTTLVVPACGPRPTS